MPKSLNTLPQSDNQRQVISHPLLWRGFFVRGYNGWDGSARNYPPVFCILSSGGGLESSGIPLAVPAAVCSRARDGVHRRAGFAAHIGAGESLGRVRDRLVASAVDLEDGNLERIVSPAPHNPTPPSLSTAQGRESPLPAGYNQGYGRERAIETAHSNMADNRPAGRSAERVRAFDWTSDHAAESRRNHPGHHSVALRPYSLA